MKFRYLLSVFIMVAYWMGICAHKRKNTVQTFIDHNETIAEYEKQHYNNYSTAALNDEWSEMDSEMTTEICQIYLRKIFPIRDLTLRSHRIIEGVVRYNNFPAAVTVTTLACELFSASDSRAYFHFIKAHRPDCVYLLNRRTAKTYKDFYIALEVCGFHTFKHLKESGILEKAIFKVKHNLKRSGQDSPEEQRTHEMNHLKDYLHDKVKYEMWPELEQKHSQEYCKFLLNKIFPRTHFHEITPKCRNLQLHYVRIRDENGHQYLKRIVAAVFCSVTKNNKNLQNEYQFIRAPSSIPFTCAFLTQKSQRNPNVFRISQLICERENSEAESYEHGLLSDDARNVRTASGQNKMGSSSNKNDESFTIIRPSAVMEKNALKQEMSDT